MDLVESGGGDGSGLNDARLPDDTKELNWLYYTDHDFRGCVSTATTKRRRTGRDFAEHKSRKKNGPWNRNLPVRLWVGDGLVVQNGFRKLPIRLSRSSADHGNYASRMQCVARVPLHCRVLVDTFN